VATKTKTLTPDQANYEIHHKQELPKGAFVDGNLEVVQPVKNRGFDIDLEQITVDGIVFIGSEQYRTVEGNVLMSDISADSVILRPEYSLVGNLVLNRAELGEGSEWWNASLYLAGRFEGGLHILGTDLHGTVDLSTGTGPEYIKVHPKYAERIHRAAPTVPLMEVGAFSNGE